MTNKFYLLSGHTSTGNLESIDERVLGESDNQNILVLNLSFQDPKKLSKKKDFFSRYFTELGASNVIFLSEENLASNQDEYFQKAGILYLPGGDTEILIQNIDKHNLISRISSFEGILSGNGAGAYALCPEYLKIRDGGVEVVPGTLGLVDFHIKGYYKPPKFDDALKNLSKLRKIYALKNGSAICRSTELEFIGDVYQFFKGRITRVN